MIARAPDPDILAIRRARRQQKRCIACGERTPRAALCAVCRLDWRYCPRCEGLYEYHGVRCERGRATAYCQACHNKMRSAARTPRADWRKAQRARVNVRLPQIIALYRTGLSHATIARAIGLSIEGVRSIIRRARQTGRWPKRLRRRIAHADAD